MKGWADKTKRKSEEGTEKQEREDGRKEETGVHVSERKERKEEDSVKKN